MHWWHVYVWFFSGVLVFSAVGRIALFFAKREAVSRMDLGGGLISLAAIPALFGFAYQRALASQTLWMVLCILFLALSAYEFFTPKMKTLYRKGWRPATAVIALQCVLGGPGMWAMIRYAFFDPAVWG